ncbi:hypothetical protein, partial [Xanthomonas citri]|uniref:hypothetical protein n=1 Tax=Xanthomonas citri TaxID=346 RepID=UPI001C1F7C24
DKVPTVRGRHGRHQPEVCGFHSDWLPDANTLSNCAPLTMRPCLQWKKTSEVGSVQLRSTRQQYATPRAPQRSALQSRARSARAQTN